MAVTYRIDPSERIVYLTTAGQSPFEEWRDVMMVVLADPAYRPGFDFLNDRTLQEDLPTADYAKSALHFLRVHRWQMGRCRWAVVAGSDALYGRGRMFSALSQSHGIEGEMFRDLDDARRWLLDGRPR